MDEPGAGMAGGVPRPGATATHLPAAPCRSMSLVATNARRGHEQHVRRLPGASRRSADEGQGRRRPCSSAHTSAVASSPLGNLGTYRPTHLQTYTPTDLQTYRPTDLQTYRPTDLQTYRPTDLQTYRPTDLQTYRPTDLQTYRPTDLQTYRPTDLQTYRPTVLESWSPGVLESMLTRGPRSTERNGHWSARNYSSSNDDPVGATPAPVEHDRGLEQHGTACWKSMVVQTDTHARRPTTAPGSKSPARSPRDHVPRALSEDDTMGSPPSTTARCRPPRPQLDRWQPAVRRGLRGESSPSMKPSSDAAPPIAVAGVGGWVSVKRRKAPSEEGAFLVFRVLFALKGVRR
ncbi:hypothetical protein EDF21_3315, partial [Frigoribacterium sp. PhB118]